MENNNLERSVKKPYLLILNALSPLIVIAITIFSGLAAVGVAFGNAWGIKNYSDIILQNNLKIVAYIGIIYLVLYIILTLVRIKSKVLNIVYVLTITLFLLLYIFSLWNPKHVFVCGLLDIYQDNHVSSCYGEYSIENLDKRYCKKAGDNSICHIKLADHYGGEYVCPEGNQSCMISVAIKENDTDLCEELLNKNSAYNRDQCLALFAEKTNNPELCKDIKFQFPYCIDNYWKTLKNN